MKEHKLDLKVFLTSIALFTIAVVGIVLKCTKEYKWFDILNLVWNYSYVTIPLFLIWVYFEKVGWRHKYWKWVGKIFHFPPDLRGRWIGEIDRIRENTPHKFVVEIKQTMTQLQVYTYSSRGHSESILDAITSDKMDDDFTLCFLWEGEHGMLKDQTADSGKFKGYTLLKLITKGESKKLKGEYFTSRKPKQTMGTLTVTWSGYELLQQFE